MNFVPKDFGQTTRADLKVQGVSKYRFSFRWTRPEIHLVRMLRQVELLREMKRTKVLAMPLYYFQRWRYQNLCLRTGTTLPLGVFEGGLSIAHIGTVTINSEARVGRNCRLHPGVTIGATRGESPRIGDDVFIGPNSVLVGNITIGDRVHIGPGVVITSDVPADTLVVAGLPLMRPRNRPTWQSERLKTQ
jgi:serine O-acetyltransferase